MTGKTNGPELPLQAIQKNTHHTEERFASIMTQTADRFTAPPLSTMTRHQGPVISYWDEKPPPKSIIDAIVCPPWCIGHHIDGESADGRAIFHYGPRFDTLGASPTLLSWVDGRPVDNTGVTAPLHIDEDVADASRVRELIAELSRVAEWLEANS